jgi:hypothetical protein
MKHRTLLGGLAATTAIAAVAVFIRGSCGCAPPTVPPVNPQISTPPTFAQLQTTGQTAGGVLSSNYPNPYLMINNFQITKKTDWANFRVPEIISQVQTYLLGTAPSSSPVTFVSDTVTTIVPDGVDQPTGQTGSATKHAITLTTGPSGSITFFLNVYLPSAGISAPSASGFPIFIGSEQSWCPMQNHLGVPSQSPVPTAPCDAGLGTDGIIAITNRGFIVAEFGRDPFMHDAQDFAPNFIQYQQSPAFTTFPGFTWGSLGGWAWGWGRALDYVVGTGGASPLATHLGVTIDTAKVMGAGHSRAANTAMYAAMMDSRITLPTINQMGQQAFRCITCGNVGPTDCSNPNNTSSQSLCSDVVYAGAPGHWTAYTANFGTANVPSGGTGSTGYAYVPLEYFTILATAAPRPIAFLYPNAFWDPHATNMTARALRQVYTALGLNPNLIMADQSAGQHQFSYGNVKQAVDFASNFWYGAALPTNDFFGNPYAAQIFTDYYPSDVNQWTWNNPTLN